MDIFINILVGFICLIIGYLFGSIPTSIIIGKVFFHQDPRDYGSHNPGGTNAGRLWGKKVGLIVILLDMFKSALAVWLTFIILCFVKFDGAIILGTAQDYIDGNWNNFLIQYPAYWVTAIGCMIGNSYPLFTGFKGGKGVATFCGIAIATSWALAVLGAIVFFSILIVKKYVSLGSICMVWAGVLSLVIWNVLVSTNVIPLSFSCFITFGNTLLINWYYVGFLVFGSALITYRHSGNIERLLNGTERKITWIKSK